MLPAPAGTLTVSVATMPVTAGSTTPFIATGGSVILCEVTYTYASTMSVYLVGNYPMTNSFYSHPRRVAQIARSAS